MTACPTPEALQHFLAGTLTNQPAEALEAHLRDCPACRQRVEGLRTWAAGPGAEPGSAVGEAHSLLTRTGVTRPAGPDPAAAPLPRLDPPRRPGDLGALGPYAVERVLGHGGMGVVLKAFDEALQRGVAIKVLRADLADEQARARFVREARAAAALRHDHIVRVHAVSGPDEPLPYLVMEYLEGPTLAAVLRERHWLEPREAAEMVAQAAAGLAAAHACGLVHRDVKPANLILDPASGRLKVADFGLARRVEGGERHTQTGAILGTPSYMPPEQASGVTRAVGPAADVYALGAVLYECLTGRPPFLADGALETLLLVLTEESVPPRRLRPGVPRDLETVCLKCLRKEPKNRYASARELAEDLGRWLRGEPIRARPAGRLERGWRWCLRNPRVATLAAALLVAVVAGLTGITWQWLRADANAAEAQAKAGLAERRRAEAEANLRTAEKRRRQADRAVDTFLTAMAEERLPNVPGMHPVRRNLLEYAAAYFQDLLREQGHADTVPDELAETYGRLAKLHDLLGSREDALAAYQKAVALLEPLARRDPGDRRRRLVLAHLYSSLAGILLQAGRRGEAASALGKSQALAEPAARAGADADFQALVGTNYGKLAGLRADTGEFAEAEALCQKAVQMHRGAVRSRPADPQLQGHLAGAYNHLGRLQRQRMQTAAALQSYEKARALWERLARDYPRHLGSAYGLGQAYHSLGELHAFGRRFEEALDFFRKARAPRVKLARLNPLVVTFQQELAETLSGLGRAHMERGKPEDALAALAEAEVILRRATAEHPDWRNGWSELAVCLVEMGTLHQQAGRPAEARRLYEEAVPLWEKLLAENPTQVKYQRGLALACNNLGSVHRAAGRPEEGLRSLGRARDLYAALARAHPDVPDYRNELAGALGNLAGFQQTLGQFEEGLRSVREAIALLEGLVRAHPDVPDYRARLVRNYGRLGYLCLQLAELRRQPSLADEAAASQAKARDHSERLVRDRPGVAPYRHLLAASYNALGVADLARGRVEEALRSLEKARELGAALVRENSTVFDYRDELARTHLETGRAHGTAGRLDAAARAFAEAITLREGLVKAAPEDTAFRVRLALAEHLLGATLCKLGKEDEGVRALRRAVAEQTVAYRKDPRAVESRRRLGRYLHALGLAEASRGRPAEVAAVARAREELWPREPSELFQAAREWATSASLIGKGEAEPAAGARAERDRYADRALDALRRAVACGFRNAAALEKDAAFAPLRARPEFAKLLREIGKGG